MFPSLDFNDLTINTNIPTDESEAKSKFMIKVNTVLLSKALEIQGIFLENIMIALLSASSFMEPIKINTSSN